MLVIALYLPALVRYQRLVRWLLILYAAVTIIMYFLIAGFGLNPIACMTMFSAADERLKLLILIGLFVIVAVVERHR